jgi:chromosome segregation ATPase
MGRPPIGKRAMTGLERLHRHRAKLRASKPETKPDGAAAEIAELKLHVEQAHQRIAEHVEHIENVHKRIAERDEYIEWLQHQIAGLVSGDPALQRRLERAFQAFCTKIIARTEAASSKKAAKSAQRLTKP